MSTAPQLAIIPTAGPWVALTPEQIMERTGWSRATFYRRRPELVARPTADGHTEYFEPSIPAMTAQTQLAVIPAATQLGPLFANLPAVSSERVKLPDPQAQAQAEQRLAILQPVIDFPIDPERFSALSLPDGRRVTSLERMIEYAAANCKPPVSPRTLKRWLAAYRTQGPNALADRIRADKGHSRWFQQHREAAILAAYLFLNERQSITFVCEQIEREAAQLAIDELPSRETVRVFLSQEISPA